MYEYGQWLAYLFLVDLVDFGKVVPELFWNVKVVDLFC